MGQEQISLTSQKEYTSKRYVLINLLMVPNALQFVRQADDFVKFVQKYIGHSTLL